MCICVILFLKNRYLIDITSGSQKHFDKLNKNQLSHTYQREMKRFGTELMLVYCLVLLDDGLQTASVSGELNDV